MNGYNKINTYAKLFSPANFKKVISNGDCSTIVRKIEKYHAYHQKDSVKTYGEIINSLYRNMLHSYRNEYIYKNTIINKLLLGKHSTNTTTVLNEFRIGKSKADLLFINGQVILYEIKSEYDNPDRLESQIIEYQKAVDQIYLVVGPKDTNYYLASNIPHTIGILELTNRGTLSTQRVATKTFGNLNHDILFKLLRKDEYLSLINRFYSFVPNVPNTQIYRECLRLSKSIDIIEFQKLIFNKLKDRKLRDAIDFNSNRTPYALKHVCYFSDPNQKEYQNLYSFLNMGA
ncbi:MAG: sce7726 family protein [Candidatus Marinimicrobia bacterium]|nr:sce7726 family protein [Candidatus Neomarinimicrobiota bacterium]